MTLKVSIVARVVALGVLGFSLIGAGQFPVAAVAAARFAATPTATTSGPVSTSPVSGSLVYTAIDAPDTVADDTANDDAPRPVRLATLVSRTMETSAPSATADAECLARAVYFESRGEPLEGQLAVAQVILNRVASGRFAGSVCGVINQRGQFSFNPARAPAESRDWRTAKAIAIIAIDEDWSAIAPQATAFHATRVNASWTNLHKVGTIGNHIFYR